MHTVLCKAVLAHFFPTATQFLQLYHCGCDSLQLWASEGCAHVFCVQQIHPHQLFWGFRTRFCSTEWKCELLPRAGEGKKRQTPLIRALMTAK